VLWQIKDAKLQIDTVLLYKLKTAWFNREIKRIPSGFILESTSSGNIVWHPNVSCGGQALPLHCGAELERRK